VSSVVGATLRLALACAIAAQGGCRCVDRAAPADGPRRGATRGGGAAGGRTASERSARAESWHDARRRARPLPTVIGGARPTRIYAPRALRDGRAGKRRYPLLLLLHGYGFNGAGFARGLGFLALVERAPLLLLAPDGRFNRVKRRFWNADRLCCDFFDEGKRGDDARYLRGLLDRVLASFPVDRRRVYVIGHSNGGNMAYRLACVASDVLAAVISFAGSTERHGCRPTRPLSLLQIHGDADPVVPYKPALRRRPLGRVAKLPGAIGTLSIWARLSGCKGSLGNASALSDRITARSFAGCPAHVDATLWTVRGGDHTSRLLPRFAERTWRWLAAHPAAN
jgi:polyhydroxybutyrate depolymerase